MKRFIGLEIEDWEAVLKGLEASERWANSFKVSDNTKRIRGLIEEKLGKTPPLGAGRE